MKSIDPFKTDGRRWLAEDVKLKSIVQNSKTLSDQQSTSNITDPVLGRTRDTNGHQPRSSYKRSGVYMDDADERRPLLSKEELAEQIEDCHRRIIEREQEYERRAENLEDAAAQFEKIPPRIASEEILTIFNAISKPRCRLTKM
ncbi:hypothetical protein MAR_009329 [Mya arenaria]|uniref:Uncharacterized protein n=1 Tax=Mya arenaria TaxID=6604 RepID=A0ABY7E6J5_MYAAR|nr:hypothetical protein MAR_009329 [Mya arenaria]